MTRKPGRRFTKGSETCRTLWADIEQKLAGSDYAVGDRFSIVDLLACDMETELPHRTRHARMIAGHGAVQRVSQAERLARS